MTSTSKTSCQPHKPDSHCRECANYTLNQTGHLANVFVLHPMHSYDEDCNYQPTAAYRAQIEAEILEKRA